LIRGQELIAAGSVLITHMRERLEQVMRGSLYTKPTSSRIVKVDGRELMGSDISPKVSSQLLGCFPRLFLGVEDEAVDWPRLVFE
jgi:hypothetical protein